MNFFTRLFLKRSSTHPAKADQTVTAKTAGVPVNQSSWYLTHTTSVSREFEFLLTEFGFGITQHGFLGHEFWIVYSKGQIELEIWSDHGDLPFILIRNRALPYDESKHLDNRDDVDEYSAKAKGIRQEWHERKDPISERFLHEWLQNDNLDTSELNRDYELFGKQEHVEYLREAALTVREHLMLRKGVLKTTL